MFNKPGYGFRPMRQERRADSEQHSRANAIDLALGLSKGARGLQTCVDKPQHGDEGFGNRGRPNCSSPSKYIGSAALQPRPAGEALHEAGGFNSATSVL